MKTYSDLSKDFADRLFAMGLGRTVGMDGKLPYSRDIPTERSNLMLSEREVDSLLYEGFTSMEIDTYNNIHEVLQENKAIQQEGGGVDLSIKYSVIIKDTHTGKVRLYHPNLDWLENSVFWWTDGNFGCDCNREMSFQRAGGEEANMESKCGHSRYFVPYAILGDGTVIEIDEFTPAEHIDY